MCLNALQPWSVPSPTSRSEAAADFTPRGVWTEWPGKAAQKRGQVNWTWKEEEEASC